MKFTPDYREIVRLSSGEDAVLRLLRPEDKERLADGFAHLSVETRFYRFFAVKETLSDAELHYLTDIDGDAHVAFGAALAVHTPDGVVEGEGLAVARFVRLREDRAIAEAAIVVVDAWKGHGLGRVMFERLIDAARERGIEKLRCEVLSQNDAMRQLLRKIAPDAELQAAIEAELQGHGADDILVVDLPLPPHTGDDDASYKSSALYRLLIMAAQQLVIVRRAFDWLARLTPGKKPPTT